MKFLSSWPVAIHSAIPYLAQTSPKRNSNLVIEIMMKLFRIKQMFAELRSTSDIEAGSAVHGEDTRPKIRFDLADSTNKGDIWGRLSLRYSRVCVSIISLGIGLNHRALSTRTTSSKLTIEYPII